MAGSGNGGVSDDRSGSGILSELEAQVQSLMEWVFGGVALGGFVLLGYLFWPRAKDIRAIIHWRGDDGLIYQGRLERIDETQLYYLVEIQGKREKVWIGYDKLV